MRGQALARVAAMVSVAVVAMLGPPRPATAKLSQAQKCQKAIDKAGAKFFTARLKKLQKCGLRALKGKGTLAGCLTNTKKPSIKARKLRACTNVVLSSLGFDKCSTRGNCATAVSTTEDLRTCLECSHGFEAECLFALEFGLTPPSGCAGPASPSGAFLDGPVWP